MSFNFDTSFLYNNQELSATFERLKHYSSDHCGICNKPDAETFWPNPTSRWAHFPCISKISPAENLLTKTINELFKDDRRHQNILHRYAVAAVMEKCKPATLSEFADTNGIEAVTKLFNTVGVAAAKQLAEQITQQKQKDEVFEDFQNAKRVTKLLGLASNALTEFGVAKL